MHLIIVFLKLEKQLNPFIASNGVYRKMKHQNVTIQGNSFRYMDFINTTTLSHKCSAISTYILYIGRLLHNVLTKIYYLYARVCEQNQDNTMITDVFV